MKIFKIYYKVKVTKTGIQKVCTMKYRPRPTSGSRSLLWEPPPYNMATQHIEKRKTRCFYENLQKRKMQEIFENKEIILMKQ